MASAVERLKELIRSTVTGRWRLGFTRGSVAGSDSHSRSKVDAGYGPNGLSALRVSSGLLDVVLASGTPVALVHEDGLPGRPAVLGVLWHEGNAPSNLSAWVRANFQENPGNVELGATNSVHIRAGANTGDLNPQGAEEVVLESDSSSEAPSGVLTEQTVTDGLATVKATVQALRATTYATGSPTPATHGDINIALKWVEETVKALESGGSTYIKASD